MVAFIPPRTYEHFNNHHVEGSIVGYIDPVSATFIPVNIQSFDSPRRIFAIWRRVITYHLSQGNWHFVHDNALFDAFERSLGEFQVRMQQTDTGMSRLDTLQHREEFDRIVVWFNDLRHPASTPANG